MHGRIVEVAVRPGDLVTKGSPLFSMEAMKMEHGIVAPFAGRVEDVRVAAGQQVERGQPAIVMERADPTLVD
jgi:3-methylcrotonyl-CoA carboxylase alpha subunit